MRLRVLAVVALLAVFAVPSQARDFVINPQVGITGLNYATDADIKDSMQPGFALGGNLRFGKKLYLSPGIYWQKTSLEVTQFDDITLEDVTDDLALSSIFVPVRVGYNFSSNESAGGIGLHAFAGPGATWVTGVDDNAFGIEKDDYESVAWGGEIGAGVDISAFTIDASYEIGLSEVFKDDPTSTKANVLRGLFGMRF